MYQASIIILGILPWLICEISSKFSPKTHVPSPLKIMAWTYAIGYTLKSLYIAYAVGGTAHWKTRELSFDIIPLGQIAILISAISLIFGYFLFFRYPTTYQKPSLASRMSVNWVYPPFFAICLGLMVIYFQKMGLLQQLLTLQFRTSKFFLDESTGIKSSLAFLTMGSDFIIVAALFFALATEKLRPYYVHIMALIFVSICFMMVGRRNGVMIPMILGLIVLPVRLKIFPSQHLVSYLRQWRIIILICALIIPLAFVSQIRGTNSEINASDLSFAQAFETAAEHTLQGAYFLDPAKTAVIIDHTMENKSYLYGETFLKFLYAPIPRILWPEKPNIRIGPYVAQNILGYYNSSGAPPGGVAELYLNFGWAGIILGSFILGALMALIHKNALSADNPAIGCIKYALYMMCIILFFTTDFSAAMISLIRYAIALFICEMFWTQRLNRLLKI